MNAPAEVVESDPSTAMTAEIKGVAAAPMQAAQAAPQGVAPLVAMLASGQLQAEHVEQALALQKQHDEYDAKRAFSVALAKFRAQVGNVAKDREGHHKGTYYATLGAVAKTIAEPLASNGLSYYWTDSQADNGALMVTCHLMHELGHEITTSLSAAPDTQGAKSPIQAIASARSYLCRYTLLGLLGLATEDDDGRSADVPPEPVITDAQVSELVAMLDEIETAFPGNRKRFRAGPAKNFADAETPLGMVVPADKLVKVKAHLSTKLKEARAKASSE